MARGFSTLGLIAAVAAGLCTGTVVLGAAGPHTPDVVNQETFQIDPSSINQKRDPRLERLAWKMIAELKDPSYDVRFFARQTLLRLGRAAIEPLEFAVRADDSETRLAALSMLTALRGRGFMGVGMLQVAAPVEGELEPDEFAPTQVTLTQIVPGSPASSANILSGDVIIELNGQPIQTNNDLYREVILTGPARTIGVTVLRGGQKLRMNMLLTLNRGVVPEHATRGLQAYKPPDPPLNLEVELAPSDRPSADMQIALNQQFRQPMVVGAGVVIVNGQIVAQNPQVPPDPNAGPQPAGRTLDAAFVEAAEKKLLELKTDAMAK